MKSSFVRKSKAGDDTQLVKELPRACYPSSLNANLLFTSMGLHELDDMVGGGAMVQGLVGVAQDHLRHWKTIARYFASQAIGSGQGLVVVGARDCDPHAFLRADVASVVDSLPREPVVSSQQPLNVEGVKIAWRYKAQLLEKPSLSGSDQIKSLRRCDYFDLSKASPAEQAQAILHQPGQLETTLNDISKAVEAFNTGINDPTQRSPPIVRVLILGFGSGLWAEESQAEQRKFILALRKLIRRSLAVGMICLAPPADSNLTHCFDQSISLSSFEGDSATFPGYTGTLSLERTIGLFSAARWQPDCRQYLFRRTRRSLHVERLYMPPEDRAQSDLACATSGGGGGAGNGLDF